MDPSEPRWRANSSFSPPLSTRWDCRYQSDGLFQEIPGDPLHGSSLSSHSKGSRSVTSSDQYANHHHSVSDGALSYFESPSNNLQASRWTPPGQKYDLGEFSTPTGGTRINSSTSPQSNDHQFTTHVSTTSHSLFSPPLAESTRLASSSKHPTFLPSRNFPGRRSFMSTPVYPLVFRNPVSDGESSGVAGTGASHRMVPSDHSRNSPPWLENTFIHELKFHKALTDFQMIGFSPDTEANSRRERIKWSNGSSCDFGFDGDSIDAMDHINADYNTRSPKCPARYQKCGLCYRMLSQKSPWSSQRIVRSRDLPVTGILPCGHVFHADCLEEATPKSLLHEPPCPLCLNLAIHEGPTSLSEPLLQIAPRPISPWTRGVGATSNYAGSSKDKNVVLRRNQSQQSRGSSSVSRRLRKRLSFKGRISRDLFGTKIFKM